MTDLRVDVDGLDALADHLDAVVEGMRNARSRVRRDGHDLGDEAVRRAVGNFDQRWDDGLQTLVDDGEVLSTMLRESAQTFRDTDRSLADGLTTRVGS